MSIATALDNAFKYLSQEDVDIPLDIWQKALTARVFKAADDLKQISKTYKDRIEIALDLFFGGKSLTASRNEFKRATVESFGGAFDSGWVDGGSELPADSETLAWFNARVNAEFGYIDLLFEQAKQLRKEEGNHSDWITERVNGYVNTLKEIYNNAKLRAMKDMMVIFDGDDGDKPCDTCKKLKGKRHKISWFVNRDYVPPHGLGLDCAKGGHCMHYLRDEKGNRVTI